MPPAQAGYRPVPFGDFAAEVRNIYRAGDRPPQSYCYIFHVLDILEKAPAVATTADITARLIADAIRGFEGHRRCPKSGSSVSQKINALETLVGIASGAGYIREDVDFPQAHRREVVNSGLVELATRGLSHRTYRTAYQNFAQFLGRSTPQGALEDLLSRTEPDAYCVVEDFREHELDRGLRASTVAGEISAINRLVYIAYDNNLTDFCFTVECTSPRNSPPRQLIYCGFEHALEEFEEEKRRDLERAVDEFIERLPDGLRAEVRRVRDDGMTPPPVGSEGAGGPARPWTRLVILRGPSDPPIVLGREKPALTSPQRRVVGALIDAGPAGCSLARLRVLSGDAWGVLQRLAGSDPDWGAVIHFPEKQWSGGSYRIDFPPAASLKSSVGHITDPQKGPVSPQTLFGDRALRRG